MFEKSKSRLNLVKDTFSRSTFDADSEYDISFEMNSLFLDENMLTNGKKHRKTMKNTVFSDLMIYTISARVYYFQDNFISKDVSHRGLCWVEKELQVYVKQGRNVENTAILEGALIPSFSGFSPAVIHFHYKPVIEMSQYCSLKSFLQNETSPSSNGSAIPEKTSKYQLHPQNIDFEGRNRPFEVVFTAIFHR